MPAEIKTRPIVDFLVCLTLVAIATAATAIGYFLSACPSGTNIIGWVLLWALAMLLNYPVLLILGPTGAFALASSFPRVRSQRFTLAAVICIILLAIGGWIAASLTDATARCSLGF